MTNTLAYLRGHRIWMIRDFVVWGSLAAGEFSFLLTDDSMIPKRILFMMLPLGGELQKIKFADLVDFRGNSLPESLVNPKVMAVQKGAAGVAVVGRENSESFTLACTSENQASAICDLIIIEVG